MRKIMFVCFCVLVMGILGCGKKLPDGMPDLCPCTLVILQEGKPVDDVLIRLYPEDKSLANWTVGGISQKNGEAVLMTLGEYKGAPAGKYKVTAVKTLIKDKEGATITPEQAAKGESVPQVKTVYVNPKYENEDSTDLTIEIGAGTKRAEIDLGAAFNKEEGYDPNKIGR